MPAVAPTLDGGAPTPPGGLRLAEVVAASGLPASTIHHYRRAGLLPPTAGAAGSLRYGPEHVAALRQIRSLREDQGLPLEVIAEVLPGLLAGDDGALAACDAAGGRRRVVRAGIAEFSTRSFSEVTMAEVAAAAGMAKGTVYRYFDSKEALFTAVVEALLDDTAEAFAGAVRREGAVPGGVSPEAAAPAFAAVVAGAMPILLELGARAAKGYAESQELARRVLVTLARAAGGPLVPGGGGEEGDRAAAQAGLALIEAAFAQVLRWSVADTWPDGVPLPAAPARRRRTPRPA